MIGVYLKELAALLTKSLKDEMTKEAFLEATAEKKILFVPETEKATVPANVQRVYVKDGAFIVGCHPEKVWYNIPLISNTKLDKLL